MRIDSSRFAASQFRAERMGVPADEAEEFLKDLTTESNEKVASSVAKPLLRIFEGKQIQSSDVQRLKGVMSTLHPYGQPDANKRLDWKELDEWTEEQRGAIKLLVATLEGWLYGEHPINIKPEYFNLVVHLVNRLAKIAEHKTETAGHERFVPDFDVESLRHFVEDVKSFYAEFLSPDRVDKKITEAREPFVKASAEIKELEDRKARQIQEKKEQNETDPAILKQEKNIQKYTKDIDEYKNKNWDKILRDASDLVKKVIEAIRGKVKQSSDNPKLWSVYNFIVRNREQLEIDIAHGSKYGRHELSSVLRNLFYIEFQGKDFSDFSDILDDLEKEFPPNVVAEKTPIAEPLKDLKIRGNDFGALAALRGNLSSPVSADTLGDLLFGQPQQIGQYLKNLQNQQCLMADESQKLSKMKAVETSALDAEISRLTIKYREMYTENNKVGAMMDLKRFTVDQFEKSAVSMLQDLNRPGAGLYLLKSILVILKAGISGRVLLVDDSKSVEQVDVYDLAAAGFNLGQNKGAQVFDMEEGSKGYYDSEYKQTITSGTKFDVVHYLPQHMPFAGVAAAMILEKKRKKA